MGVDEEGLIICPTEVFAGASSVTATASPSEALRFFLDFFSVDLVRENGWYYVLEHEGLGEMCDAVAVQNSSRYPDGEAKPAQPELAIIQSRAARALT